MARGRLRNRIIAWSFFPTSIILGTVALVLFISYQRVAEDLVIGRNRELTRLYAGQLGSELTAYVELLSDLSQAPGIAKGNARQQVAALEAARNGLVVFDAGAVLLDGRGHILAAIDDGETLVGSDWSSQTFFREVLRTGSPAFSDVTSEGPGGKQVLAIAVPIGGDQSGSRGVLAGMFRLGATTFSAFYGGIIKLRISDMMVVDSYGVLIYHPDTSRIGTPLPEPWIVSRFSNGEVDALRTRDTQGKDILASFAPVPGTPWGLVSEESWSEVTASSRLFTIFLVFLLAAGVAVPALVVTVGVGRLTRPIAELIRVAQEVAGGRFGRTVESRTGDELEELATQINYMSSQLQESYANLEHKVETRTHELATLLDVTQAASSSLDLDQVLQRVAGGLASSVGLRHCIIYLLDERTNLLVPSGGRSEMREAGSISGRGPEVHPLDPRRDAFVREIIESKKPVACADAASDPRMDQQDVLLFGVRSVLGIPLVVRDQVVALAMIATFDERREFTSEEIRLAWGIANAVGLTIENARLFQAEQARHEEAEGRRRVAEGLREILAVLNSKQTLPEILDYIVSQACQLVGCDGASILQPGGEDSRLDFRASCGLDPEVAAKLTIPIGGGAAGRAMKERRPISLPDTATLLVRQPDGMGWPSELELPLVQRFVAQYRTLLTVPLIGRDTPLGALALYYQQAQDFTEEHVHLAQSVAHQAALAIESARLREQAGLSAALAERSRLARELHDSVTQSLYSVALYGEAAARMLTDGKNTEAASLLRELSQTAQEALREMRLLIFQLRPPSVEKSGLMGALQARLDAVELRGLSQASLEVEGVELAPLAPIAIQEEVYNIAQEALNNVLRHSKAKNVLVNLRFAETSIEVDVRDDGTGFDLQTASSRGGLGLPGVRERAAKIDAKLEIESQPGKGTRVSLSVPLPPLHKGDQRSL
jgi:signal transduction histidine kinase/HAMP domain-containing protein